MVRIFLSAALAFLTLGFLASSANALPQNTPIFRACVIDYANDYFHGNDSLFGINSMHYAILMAREHCASAGLR